MIRHSRRTWALPTHRSPRATIHVAGPLRLAATAAMVIGTLAGCATREVPPANTTLPESLRTPPQEVLEDALTAVGETIYICRRERGQLSWVGQGSEATLVDGARRNVGTLVPGPRFVAYDGSYMAGRVAAEEIVATDALPWQLIVARRISGTEKGRGRFAKVTSVQQVRTRGGIPPVPGCTQQGMSLWVPFSATYLVYRPSIQPLANPAAEGATASPVPTTAPVAAPLSFTPRRATIARAAAASHSPSAMPVAVGVSPLAQVPLVAAAPITAPAAPPASSEPALIVASASETSRSGVPTFFDSLYVRP